MRSLLRWLQRNILLLFSEEWHKARVDTATAEAVHRVEADCTAEVQMLRVGIKGLTSLEREAARALMDSPAAAEFIVHMLRQRMEALAYGLAEHGRSAKSA